MTIMKSTTDYGRFKKLKANRTPTELGILNMMKVLKKRNKLNVNPVIIDEDWNLYDGQHRVEAAKRLGLKLYYLQDDDLTIDDVRMFNTNVLRWGLMDWLDSFIAEGLIDYVYLKEFYQKHKITPTTAMAILSMEIGDSWFRAPYLVFRSGDFTVKDKELSDEFVKFYKEVAKFTEENTWKDRDFVSALNRIFQSEELTAEDFLDQLARYGKQIFRSANVKNYMRQFEDVLNYGAGRGNTRLY